MPEAQTKSPPTIAQMADHLLTLTTYLRREVESKGVTDPLLRRRVDKIIEQSQHEVRMTRQGLRG